MTIGRIKRRSNFAAIPNALMRDTRISIEARGLLALMMGMGSEWTFRAADLMKRCGVKKDKYQRMVRELKDVGYLVITPKQDETGKLQGYEYEVFDEPGSLENRQPVEQVGVETGYLRRPSIKNTNNKKPHTPKGDLFGGSNEPSQKDTEKEPDQELFDEFWRRYPKSPRKTDKPKARKVFWSIVLGKHKEIPKTDVQLILAGVSLYAQEVDPKFIAMPTTWLNGERWDAYEHKRSEPVDPDNDPNNWEETVT